MYLVVVGVYIFEEFLLSAVQATIKVWGAYGYTAKLCTRQTRLRTYFNIIIL